MSEGNLSCPIPPAILTCVPKPVCADPGRENTTSVGPCSEILVKFGEVQAEVEIEFGYLSRYFGQRPRLQAVKKNATYDFKYSKPEYLAGSLIQVHDFYCDGGREFIEKPETKTVKARMYGNQVADVKLFKLTPWEFFGNTPSNAKYFDFRDGPGLYTRYRTDFNKNISWEDPDKANDKRGLLRDSYYNEAQNVIKLLKTQQKAYENYLDKRLIEYVDYTSLMKSLWGLAAAGQLSMESITGKLRIGEDASNPGTTRKVKIVFNLYFKIVTAQFASNADTALTTIKLNERAFEEAGISHIDRRCLEAVISLNKDDGSTNDKGVYFHGMAWGTADPGETFIKNVEAGKPASDNTRASGKSGWRTEESAFPFYPANRNGDKISRNDESSWTVLRDEDGNLGKALNKADKVNFFYNEKKWTVAASAAVEAGKPIPNTIIYDSFWTNKSDVKPINISRPIVEEGDNGFEMFPGFNLYFTAGQNVGNGDIQGCSGQLQILMPLEAFAVLGDDDLTLETLPGTFWNIFSTATGFIKIDIVKVTKDSFAIKNTIQKQAAVKRQIREMKKYLESMQGRVNALLGEMTTAFNNRDLAKYQEALQKLQSLADEFYSRTQQRIDMTSAYNGKNTLQSFINAQNQLINPPVLPNVLAPSPASPPPATDPNPEAPVFNSIANPPAAKDIGERLVIAGDTIPNIQRTTGLTVDPFILTPTPQPANFSSQEALGFNGAQLNFFNMPDYNNWPPDDIWLF